MSFFKSEKQPIDILLEISGIIVILGSFLFLTINYQDLPDSIPRHYGADGVPDAYGGKGVIWVLPAVGFVLYFVIGLISHVPGVINLPFKPAPEQAEFYQKRYARMIRILNLAMVCVFAFLTYLSAQVGLGTQTQLPRFFTLVAVTLMISIPFAFIIPDMIKAKRQNRY